MKRKFILKNFESHIGPGVLKSLHDILGKKLATGRLTGSPDFRMWNSRVECKEIAISMWDSNLFLVIKSDWQGDTDNEGLACHKLELELTEFPSLLNIEIIARESGSVRKMDSLPSLNFYENISQIREIRIYNYTEESNGEIVKYDKAVVIFSENQNPLIVKCVWGIQGGLYIQTSQEAFKELEAECSLRETITN